MLDVNICALGQEGFGNAAIILSGIFGPLYSLYTRKVYCLHCVNPTLTLPSKSLATVCLCHFHNLLLPPMRTHTFARCFVSNASILALLAIWNIGFVDDTRDTETTGTRKHYTDSASSPVYLVCTKSR